MTELDLTQGVLMGIVNVTPDSFSDGGVFVDPDKAIAHGLRLVSEGALLIDVGGESTRPGAEPVPAEVEKARVMPVIEGLVAEGVVVSVDTYKPVVAEAALNAGAQVVNDVTGCRSDGMVRLVSDANCAVVVMHMQGTPVDMHTDPIYSDVVSEVEVFLLAATERLLDAGVVGSQIAIDPGIGFGKRSGHNLSLIAGLARLADLGFPVVLGASRKGFLGATVGISDRYDRDLATAVTTAIGFASGVRVFRVHDIVSSIQALKIAYAVHAAHPTNTT